MIRNSGALAAAALEQQTAKHPKPQRNRRVHSRLQKIKTIYCKT
jgi:hypothetical protein